MKWSKPVTAKLRKKNTPTGLNIADHPSNSKDSVADEPPNDGESWSLLLAPESPSFSPQEMEDMIKDIDEIPLRSYEDHPGSSSRDSQSSGDSDWSLIDAEPQQDQREVEESQPLTTPYVFVEPEQNQAAVKSESIIRPSIVIEPPTSNCREAASSDPVETESTSTPVNLEDIGQSIKQLKVDQRNLSGASRDHFKKQATQLYHLQKRRWEVEASRDEVEKNVEEHKDARARSPELEKHLQAFQQYRNELRVPDEEIDETLFAGVNTRERAIVRNRGTHAQRNRGINRKNSPHAYSAIEGPLANYRLTNHGGDFPYKPWSFIHRDVKSIYDHNGKHVGYQHKHMPSYKRRQIAFELNSLDEMMMELGRQPVKERMKELFKCEKFTQTVSMATKERRAQTKWYTERKMSDLLGKSSVEESDVRHDSVADQP